MADKIVLAFDAYGTLLSTESIAKQLATHVGKEKATSIAATWRKYQLEYTWRMITMGMYYDFEKVTRGSLEHALGESGVSLSHHDIDALMKAYDSLSIFPDVGPCIEKLQATGRFKAVVFSNGTPQMVGNSIHKSPDLQPYTAFFEDIVTVDELQMYKPGMKVYQHLAAKVDRLQDKSKLWLVSGNPFDIVGARYAGLSAAWVDRAGIGWHDRLLSDDKGRPNIIVSSLEELADKILAATS